MNLIESESTQWILLSVCHWGLPKLTGLRQDSKSEEFSRVHKHPCVHVVRVTYYVALYTRAPRVQRRYLQFRLLVYFEVGQTLHACSYVYAIVPCWRGCELAGCVMHVANAWWTACSVVSHNRSTSKAERKDLLGGAHISGRGD